MYNKGSAEFNELINKAGGNALITRFTFSDFSIEKFTKLEYYGGSNNSDDIAIGTTNMAYLDVGTVTDKIITNQEFLFEVGMELSDGTIEYAPMGYFKVQSPDSDEDIVNFKAYDRMQKFEKPYVSSLTYPTNSSQILNELCAMCGVELATPIASPITITDKLDGYTCREILGYIAGIHGLFACFDRYGKLNLCWYNETPIEKQIGLIWSLTKSQSNYKVEKITIAKDTENTYTSGTGISGINHSNPYATQEIADSIYTSLGNFTYRPCEISMLDDIRLDPWDMLKVTYLDGSVLTIPIMSLEHSFTSGETRVKSFGKTDTENEYSYSGPVTQAMDRMATELLVANRIIATKVDAEWVNAHTVTADKIEATNARVEALETNSLTVETADLRYATITNLNAQTARIEDLEATALTADSAIITNLQTGKLNTSDLNAEVAKLGYLTANSADLKYANITFGNIDTANIDVANIGLLFTKVGLIDRATIIDGHITGFLDAVEINANNITAGTLIADRILLKGSESGLLYALNNLGELTSTEVDTLDGTILTQRTVTADKLVANSITANELDVTNIFGNSAVLSTLVSQEAFINAISTNKVVVGAYNKSQSIIDNIYSPGTTTIDGSKITTGSITANKLFVKELTSLSSNIAGFQIKGGNPIYPLLATIKSGSFIQNADGSWTLKGSIGFPQVPYIGDTVVFTFLYQALEDIVNLEITISGSYNGVNLNDKVISLQLLSPTGGDYSVLKKDCGVLQLTDSNGALKTPSLVTITITSDKLLNIEEMHVSGLVSDGRITYNTDSFATDDDSLYISNNGISLGKNFSVTNTGYAQMSSGKIGGFDITGTSLRGGYPLVEGHNYTFELNPTNLNYVGSDILNIVDRYYSSGAEQFRIGGLRVYTADSTGSIKVEARNFECTNLLEAYQIRSTADITSVGDIIAGLGTSNQVSLLGLKVEVNKRRKTIIQTELAGEQSVTAYFPNYLTNYLILINTYGQGNAQNNAQLYMVSTGSDSSKTSTVTPIFATLRTVTFNWNSALSLGIQANKTTWNIVTIY